MKAKQIIYKALTSILLLTLLVIACDKMDPEPPAGEGSFIQGTKAGVSVLAPSEINYNSAKINVIVYATGGRKVSRLLLCYSTTKQQPDTTDLKVDLGTVGAKENNKVLVATLTNLTHNTKYYYRAFAKNSIGLSNSSDANFTTKKDTRLPDVTVESASNITLNSATLGGTIVTVGDNSTITQHGHVWATQSNPTLSDSKTTLGTGNAGNFSSNLTELIENTTYYFRAYATNGIGTTYSSVNSFTTFGLPIVETNSVSEINITTANCGGNVTKEGNPPITARGVCWSTNPNPSITNSKTNDGIGTGPYNSTITGLAEATTYYVRAYATNDKGTTYGNELSFTTKTNPWKRISDFGGSARRFAMGFAINNNGYILKGSSSNNYFNDFWEYNPDTNTWTQKANFGGVGRNQSLGFAIGNKGYSGLGYTSSLLATTEFWEYDPTTNAWTQKANFGGVFRGSSVGFAIGNKGYVGTGVAGATKFKDFWEYNPDTNTWTQKADFGGEARSDAVGFAINGKGYIGIGATLSVFCKDFWEYNPTTNTWTQKTDFEGGVRSSAVGFAIGGMGYIGTGQTNTNLLKDFWEYNPTTNSWTRKTDFGGDARFGATGFAIGNKGYIGTGSISIENIDVQDFWEYNPTVDTK